MSGFATFLGYYLLFVAVIALLGAIAYKSDTKEKLVKKRANLQNLLIDLKHENLQSYYSVGGLRFGYEVNPENICQLESLIEREIKNDQMDFDHNIPGKYYLFYTDVASHYAKYDHHFTKSELRSSTQSV
jgi:hypothetical protein